MGQYNVGLMQEIYVRQAIDAGFADRDAGRVVPVADLRAGFGLKV